jgi:hypothetical protein
MVQPKQKDRFTNAELALESLKPLDVIRVPGVDFSETVLEFEANWLGEKLRRDITIKNPIPDTLLEGRWEVAPHPQDPPHTPDNHAWISVTPAQFSRNNIRCQVEVDTSKLMANKQYKRQLILHSNAYPASHTLIVKVQTAALPIEERKLPYLGLIKLFLITAVLAIATTLFITYTATSVTIWLLQNLGYEGMLFMLGVWGIVTLIGVFWSLSKVVTKLRNTKTTSYSYSDEPQTVSEYLSLAVAVSVGGSAVGLLVVSVVKFTSKLTTSELFFAVYLLACTLGGIYGVCWVVYWLINRVIYRVVDLVVDLAKDSFMARLILPVLGSGISVGTGIIIGFNTFILLALTGTSLPALSMLLYPPLKRRKLIAKYRQSEKSLIKP